MYQQKYHQNQERFQPIISETQKINNIKQNKTRKSNLHIPAARLLYYFCNAGSTHENIIGFALLQLNPQRERNTREFEPDLLRFYLTLKF